MVCSSGGDVDKKGRCGRIGNRPYWVLLLSVAIRAAHQVGAAVFLASYLVLPAGLAPAGYLFLVIISGAALMGTEAMRHRQIYREVAGVGTLLKLVLIGLAFHGFLPKGPAVLAAFLLAALAAHLPREVRHRLLY